MMLTGLPPVTDLNGYILQVIDRKKLITQSFVTVGERRMERSIGSSRIHGELDGEKTETSE